MFKQWQDKVFTLGGAFTMDGSPSQLAGKKVLVAVTAGAHRLRPLRPDLTTAAKQYNELLASFAA
nr:NAD(P)H-dependent oxidoreductase [Streptomyces botrytidirepellens]